ncbi:hypothetical protein Hanom_Chr15g01404721 [Helianthus anomalus]
MVDMSGHLINDLRFHYKRQFLHFIFAFYPLDLSLAVILFFISSSVLLLLQGSFLFTVVIMVPRKENLSESVSIMTQRQLEKFVHDYMIPTDLHRVLPAKDKTIYPFLPGKFPLYTRVCNFANYRVPFSKFLIKVLWFFFRVHLCQVNLFGLSRINHFEISCRALNRKPDLNVFRYFYEFMTAGDWYTFSHWKGIPSPAGEEKSSLKN